jgi:hypothetical protein
MIDKAAIFRAITRRNALRRTHGLSSFDVAAEYRHEISVADEGEQAGRLAPAHLPNFPALAGDCRFRTGRVR